MVVVVVVSFVLLGEGGGGVLTSRLAASFLLLFLRDPVALSDALVIAMLSLSSISKRQILR